MKSMIPAAWPAVAPNELAFVIEWAFQIKTISNAQVAAKPTNRPEIPRPRLYIRNITKTLPTSSKLPLNIGLTNAVIVDAESISSPVTKANVATVT